MRRSPRLSGIIPLLSLSLGACGYDRLDGDWEGQVDCGEDGSVAMDLEIEESGTGFYDGVGAIEGITLEGEQTTILLELELEQTQAKGEQLLKVEASCEARQQDGVSELDCSDFQELGWDGEDTISAEISDFMATGLDCELLLER